jgi:hypothetical protein
VPGWLGVTSLLASLAGLLACPQILLDDFDAPGLADDAGAGACVSGVCAGVAGGPGAGGSSAGAGGGHDAPEGPAKPMSPPPVTGPPTPPAPPLTPDPPDASAPPGADPSLGPDCWVVALDDTTHDAADNCLDIHGWNELVMDTDDLPVTVVSRRYEGGSVCIQGTIQPVGWGAVYNLTLADGAMWDGASRGVGGFRLAASGAALPPKLEVVYTTTSDFCSIVTPTADTRIPFSSAHPDCADHPGPGVPNASSLEFLRVHIPIATTAYPVDFCLQIRAIR